MPLRPTRHLRQRAAAAEHAEDWAAAAAAYRAAIARNPRPAEPHHRLGRCLEQLERWGAAAEAHRAAVDRDGGHAEYHHRLGYSLERARDPLGAAQAYRTADRLSAGVERDRPDAWRDSVLPYHKQIELNLLPRSEYAYCLRKASRLARRLGVERITALELGVAGGRGLLALERHAADLEAMTGVGVDVVGCDTGGGMPEPVDHRDLPYFFRRGNYAMDADALQARLQRAQLRLGDAAETVAALLDDDPAPIGAICFDMDYHSATAAVLAHLGDHAPAAAFLPRVWCYFDNVVGRIGQEYNEFTGELLAIGEFNDANADTKLAEDRAFRAMPLNYDWYHSIYTLHRFSHPEYATYVGRHKPSSLALPPSREDAASG